MSRSGILSPPRSWQRSSCSGRPSAPRPRVGVNTVPVLSPRSPSAGLSPVSQSGRRRRRRRVPGQGEVSRVLAAGWAVPEGGQVLPQEPDTERRRGARAGGASSLGWFGDDASGEVKEVLVDFPEVAHLLLQLAHLDRQVLLVSHQVL